MSRNLTSLSLIQSQLTLAEVRRAKLEAMWGCSASRPGAPRPVQFLDGMARLASRIACHAAGR